MAADNPTDFKVLVQLVNFSDDPNNKPFRKEQIEGIVFGPSNSLASYYNKVSNNRVKISGVVRDWMMINATSKAGEYKVCENGGGNTDGRADDDVNEWETIALTKMVGEQGVRTNDYTSIIYVFPNLKQCGGLLGLGAFDFRVPLEVSILDESLDFRVYVHEFAHNLLVDHANFLNCRDKKIDHYANCTTIEYGDYSSVMGLFTNLKGKNLLHFNGPERIGLGWMPHEQIVTVDEGRAGEFTIYALEFPSNDANHPKLLKIPKKNTSDFYYVEFRKPDEFAPIPQPEFTRGVGIKIWDGNSFSQSQAIALNTPGTADRLNNLTLANGNSYHDHINDIKITQQGHSDTTATVKVEFGNNLTPATPDFDRVCPSTRNNDAKDTCTTLNPPINIFDTVTRNSLADDFVFRKQDIYVDEMVGRDATIEEKGPVYELFKDRTRTVISKSKEAGINPSLALAYWSFAGFGGSDYADFFCNGPKGFDEQLNCFLGLGEYSAPDKSLPINCAKSKNENSQSCNLLKSEREREDRDEIDPISYPINSFDDFTEAYFPLSTWPDRVACTYTYNYIIDEVKAAGKCGIASYKSVGRDNRFGSPSPTTPIGISLNAPVCDPIDPVNGLPSNGNVKLSWNTDKIYSNISIEDKTTGTKLIERNQFSEKSWTNSVVARHEYSYKVASYSSSETDGRPVQPVEATGTFVCPTGATAIAPQVGDLVPKNLRLQGACYQVPGTNSWKAMIRWDAASGSRVKAYNLRLDADPDNDPWNNTCSSPQGDRCINNISTGFDALDLKANTKYKYWVETVLHDGTTHPTPAFSEFTCGQDVAGAPAKPELKAASCNRNTLALSWKISAGAERYQMRGGPIIPSYANRPGFDYTPSETVKDANGNVISDWLGDDAVVKNDDGKRRLVGNGEGDGVQCLGEVCSYFESGLTQGSKYKVWTNAVIGSGTNKKASPNTYFPGLIECKEEDFGYGDPRPAKPSSAFAACSNNKITVRVTNSSPNMKNHVRGFNVDGLPDEEQRKNYFPPKNWTDGVPDEKRLVHNGECNGTTCQYTLDAPTNGKYRVWVDNYFPGTNDKEDDACKDDTRCSDNYYIEGYVDCSVASQIQSVVVGGQSVSISGGSPTSIVLTPNTSDEAVVEVLVNGIARSIKFKVNRSALQSPPPEAAQFSNDEVTVICRDPASPGKRNVDVIIKRPATRYLLTLTDLADTQGSNSRTWAVDGAEDPTTFSGHSGYQKASWSVRIGYRQKVIYTRFFNVGRETLTDSLGNLEFTCPEAPAARISSALTASDPAPTSNSINILSSSCSGAQATVTWSGNFAKYDLRFDNQGDSWTGSCSSAAGDTCVNGHTGNSYTFNAKPGNYNWWIQEPGSSDIQRGTFVCSEDASVTTLQTTCNGNGTATISWPAVPGASKYALRADGPLSYSGNNCTPHNLCVSDYTGTSVTVNTTPGSYRFWMHSIDGSGNMSAVLNDKNFSCAN